MKVNPKCEQIRDDQEMRGSIDSEQVECSGGQKGYD